MDWLPTWDQISGITERLITVALASVFSFAVLKGWISKDDAVSYGAELAPIILAFAAAGYAAWRNRPKSLVQRAAAVPGTTVVTSPALANSTPEMNVVSSATSIVEPKV
jgi:hypothetical protein